jgi:hypothetical protein
MADITLLHRQIGSATRYLPKGALGSLEWAETIHKTEWETDMRMVTSEEEVARREAIEDEEHRAMVGEVSIQTCGEDMASLDLAEEGQWAREA